MGEAGAVVGDKPRAGQLFTGTSAGQSRIDGHLSVARTALAHIRADNAAAHLNYVETRRIVGKIGELLNAGASCPARNLSGEQSAATGVIKPVSSISHRRAVSSVREPRQEQPTIANLVESPRDLSKNGTVTASKVVRDKHQDITRNDGNLSKEDLIFSNSDLFGEEYEGTVQSAEQVGKVGTASTEYQSGGSDHSQHQGEAEL